MDKQTIDKLISLNEKWKIATTEEKDKIAQEVKELMDTTDISEKIKKMEEDLIKFKTTLEVAKESFDANSLEFYNQQLEILQLELEEYKKELFSTLKG